MIKQLLNLRTLFFSNLKKKLFNLFSIIIKKPNFKREEIIKVDFGINIGSELSNTYFAIVLNSDDNNDVDNL